MTKEIKNLIGQGALFVINDSAGKDSQVMKLHLLALVPKSQLVIIHAKLEGVDWEGNLEHIKKYAQGVPVFETAAKKTFFEMVEKRGMFPSPQYRQCTSDLKRDPIQKFINNYAKVNGFTIVVNCIGIRAQESPARRKLVPFKLSERNSCRHRKQFEWYPVYNLLIDAVFEQIEKAGQVPHWAYAAGMSRLSCCFCIMSSKSDLLTAARLKPELAAKYMETEEKLGFTMNMDKKYLRDIINN